MEQTTESYTKNKRRMRSVLIHKPIQREFTLVVMTILFISALTVGFVIHATIRQAMMGGGYRFGTISAYEVMSDVSYDLIIRVSLVLFITIMVIALFGIFFLHRVAGPIYRFQGVLRRISKGEIPDDIRLRENDFFVDTATDLNHVLRMLRDKRKQTEFFKNQLEEAARKSPASSESILREIKDALNKMV